jgi:uncharacterized membrane protein (DUF2068 family)
VLVGLMLFKSLLLILFALGAILTPAQEVMDWIRLSGVTNVDLETTYLAVTIALCVAVLLVFAAVGLLAYRRSGWLLAMVTTGIFIVFDILGFVGGSANYFWMGLNIVTVFYLNQREVREGVGALDVAPVGDVAEARG